MDDGLELGHQYVRLQVHVAIANDWIMFMIVPTIVSVASSIIICLYITIRHTELPIYLYILFPYVGANLFCLLFYLAYEVMMMIRASEAVYWIPCRQPKVNTIRQLQFSKGWTLGKWQSQRDHFSFVLASS